MLLSTSNQIQGVVFLLKKEKGIKVVGVVQAENQVLILQITPNMKTRARNIYKWNEKIDKT